MSQHVFQVSFTADKACVLARMRTEAKLREWTVSKSFVRAAELWIASLAVAGAPSDPDQKGQPAEHTDKENP